MFKKLFLVAASAVGGIYLTSDEGKNARETLMKKKSIFQPIIKDLTNEMNQVLEGSKELNSKEVKANIEKLIDEAKQVLLEIDLDKTVETAREAIKVASKKIREANIEAAKQKKAPSNKKAISKTNDKKKTT